MNDDTRLRSAINLDELERQLREAASSRGTPQRPAATVDDPLAELARLVGRGVPQVQVPQARPAAGPDFEFRQDLSERPAAPGGAPEAGAAVPHPGQESPRTQPMQAPANYAYPQEPFRAEPARGTAAGP